MTMGEVLGRFSPDCKGLRFSAPIDKEPALTPRSSEAHQAASRFVRRVVGRVLLESPLDPGGAAPQAPRSTASGAKTASREGVCRKRVVRIVRVIGCTFEVLEGREGPRGALPSRVLVAERS